ncbi:MAG TPA: transporter substrate-binding domain-containing protein, partial [Thermoplasmata archaeon]|nr:transporter substrate-binding domain-containing protein [Thermoplasmata archaeon]
TSSTLTCANNVCEPTDLASLTIGVQLGTTSEAWIDENVAPLMSDPANQIVRYTQVDTELAALRLGSLDAVMLDAAPAQSFASAPSSGLRVAGLVITGELYGFAVPNGDPDGLVAIINRVLARIVSDGTYDQLIEKWFG